MKKLITMVTFLLTTAVLTFAQTLSAYDIAKNCYNAKDPQTASFKATLTLINKNGKKRVREILMKSKDYGDVEKSIIVFLMPKDVSGVGYLMFEYDQADKDDDNWLYLPANKKVRRISGSEVEGDFMSTDFTYDDMGDRKVDEDTYELLGEENLNGTLCYKLNAVSKKTKEKNPRRVLYIAKDTFVLCKCELFDRQDRLQRVLECSDISNIDGYWTTGHMVMTNVQTNHSTVLEMTDVQYDQDLPDNYFTVTTLEKGIIK
ncbi:MAG: outer membrane lipoprotein-sorting protein [Treponema sp.]|nr:outer membrane lipoprotein-sorting protein [Treponema sp.]